MTQFNGTKTLLQTADDRRRRLRKRAYSAGLVVSRDGVVKVDCRVEDVTESGAKVTVTKPIPEQLYLLVVGKEVAYEAVVAWTQKYEYGLHFTKTLSAESLKDAGLRFLQRLKLERLRG